MKIKRSWILIMRKITYKNIIYRLQRLFLSHKRSPFFFHFGAFPLAAAIFSLQLKNFRTVLQSYKMRRFAPSWQYSLLPRRVNAGLTERSTSSAGFPAFSIFLIDAHWLKKASNFSDTGNYSEAWILGKQTVRRGSRK